uniref:Putative ovule protein n=1 Tax=Solanum chacoense TaxID=4108 RepID=A0A0V0H3G7_SOLCH
MKERRRRRPKQYFPYSVVVAGRFYYSGEFAGDRSCRRLLGNCRLPSGCHYIEEEFSSLFYLLFSSVLFPILCY